MTTQIQEAKNGIITDEMNKIAKKENIEAELIRQKVAQGKIVILKNNKRAESTPTGIGEGLRVKVNANVGVLESFSSLSSELDKVRVIQQAGADVLMDLSTGDLIDETRQAILSASRLPVGSVPIYQSAKDMVSNNEPIVNLTKEKLFGDIEKHAKDGVDFVTIHCGLTKQILSQIDTLDKTEKISSKGGEIIACWMRENNCENPYYEYFDELLEIVKPYDVVLSLSSVLRPRFAVNSHNRLLTAELVNFSQLAQRAYEKDVQVMIEGVGNITIDKIPQTVQLIKELTNQAPLYALSTLVCDTTIGYDNITSAIGGALAASLGADMLCATTSASRIAVANTIQVSEGVKTARISAHCADLARKNKTAIEKNLNIANATIENDWEKVIENSFDISAFEGIDIALETKSCTLCANNCIRKEK